MFYINTLQSIIRFELIIFLVLLIQIDESYNYMIKKLIEINIYRV